MSKSEIHTSPDRDVFKLASAHADRIEAFFGKKGIGGLPPSHPAIHEVKVLRDFAGGGGIPLFEQIPFLNELAILFGRAQIWPAPISANDPWSFSVVPELRLRYTTQVQNPGKYRDLMCELNTWGLLANAGLEVVPLLSEGLPDFLAACPSEAFAVEVKHVRRDSNVGATQRAMAKANRQMKETEGIPGVLYLYLERHRRRTSLSLEGPVPNDVRAKFAVVEEKLRDEQYRNLSGVFVVWDEVLMLDYGTDHATYFLVRRSHYIANGAPRYPLLSSTDAFGARAWIAIGVGLSRPTRAEPALLGRQTPREVEYNGVVATTAFRIQHELGDGIRAEQAIEVVLEPDAQEDIGGVAELFSRRVPDGVLLVVGVHANNGLEICAAFRMPDDAEAAPRAPRKLLEELLTQFGIPTGVDGGPLSLLNEDVVVRSSLDQEVREGSDAYLFCAHHARTSPSEQRIALLFALDFGSYLSAARAMQPKQAG